MASAYLLLVALEKVGGVSAVKVTDLLLGFFMADAMALLDLAQQLLTLAGDLVKIIVRQLAPLLLDFAFELHPVAFYAITVHGVLLTPEKHFAEPATKSPNAQ
jgi:hypothetical protein